MESLWKSFSNNRISPKLSSIAPGNGKSLVLAKQPPLVYNHDCPHLEVFKPSPVQELGLEPEIEVYIKCPT